MGYALTTFFVPVSNQTELAKVKDYYRDDYGDNIQYHEHTAYAAIGADSIADFEPYDLSADSNVFNEAIAIQVTTYGDDGFLYNHWLNGECVRALFYDPYQGWLSVQGLAEPWEAECFFKAGSLEQDLIGLEQSNLEKQQGIAELKDLIANRQLIEGYHYPVISGESVLFDIIQYFNLTHPSI